MRLSLLLSPNMPLLSEDEKTEKHIFRMFQKGISDYHLINDGDKILVAVSGGKDSLCLLEVLARRMRIQRPQFSLEAIHVRMSNIKYETDTEYLEKFCEDLGVHLHVKTTGFEVRPENKKTPCFLCSWNRRKMVFETAQELGCNKIALGHHQDDILHTTLLNEFYQGSFSTMPVLLEMRKMPLTIIRPLCMVRESDIKKYAAYRGYKKQIKICPYENETKRNKTAELFAMLENENPEIRFSMWNALEKAGKLIEKNE